MTVCITVTCASVGRAEGRSDGTFVSAIDPFLDGSEVGKRDGVLVGRRDGCTVG